LLFRFVGKNYHLQLYYSSALSMLHHNSLYKITWRLRIEKAATKAYRTFVRSYSLFKSDRLSTNSKLNFHKALFRSIMTYACPAWEFAADAHLMKPQRLQNKVLRTIGKFPRNTPISVMHTSLQIPYTYDYITKLCRHQAQVIQHHENIHVRNTGQGEARHIRDLTWRWSGI
jgi:hypothetical protein